MGSEPSAMRQNRDGIQLRSPAIFRGEPFGTESSASACSRCPHALEHSAETRIGSQAFVCRIVCDLDKKTGMLCEGRVEPAQGILFVTDLQVKFDKITWRHIARLGPDGHSL